MSKSVNKVLLLGHVGKAPELRNTNAKGVLIANFSVATSERRKVGDKYEDQTEWNRVTAFGKLAEIIRDYVKRGSKIYVEGRLHTESWDDNGTTRWSTGVIAKEIVLLDPRPPGAPAPPPGSFDAYAEQGEGYERGNPIPEQPITDDDIPF